MSIYTIVVESNWEGEAQGWIDTNVDTDVLSVVSIQDSAYRGHMIVRLESPLDPEDYTSLAFEGSLNYEMADFSSPVIWWNKREAA